MAVDAQTDRRDSAVWGLHGWHVIGGLGGPASWVEVGRRRLRRRVEKSAKMSGDGSAATTGRDNQSVGRRRRERRAAQPPPPQVARSRGRGTDRDRRPAVGAPPRLLWGPPRHAGHQFSNLSPSRRPPLATNPRGPVPWPRPARRRPMAGSRQSRTTVPRLRHGYGTTGAAPRTSSPCTQGRTGLYRPHHRDFLPLFSIPFRNF